jgi:hypothetical protein
VVVLAGLFGVSWISGGATPAGRSAARRRGRFELFRMGLDDFLEVETAEEGLGPAFNGASCAACHNQPAIGGVSPVTEVRAAKTGPGGAFVPLDPSGETLFHLFSIPNHACQSVLPADATIHWEMVQ